MRPVIKSGFAIALIALLAGCAGGAVVVSRPGPPPMVVRPVPPRPGMIWIDGEYYWRGGGYVYRPGYWVAPRRGRAWHPGHWQPVHGGWRWRQGYWR